MHKNTTLNLTGIIFKAVCLRNSANLLTFSLKGLHHELTLVVSFYFLFFVRSHVPIYNSKYPCLDIRCLNSSCTTSNPATSAQFHTGILVQLVAVNANFCQSLMLRCSYTKDRKGAWSYSVCVIVTSLWICSIIIAFSPCLETTRQSIEFVPRQAGLSWSNETSQTASAAV